MLAGDLLFALLKRDQLNVSVALLLNEDEKTVRCPRISSNYPVIISGTQWPRRC